MGKRIYNGTSGVVPASDTLKEANRRANAAAWANLLPEIRELYLEQNREQVRDGRAVPLVLRKGVSH